MVWSTDTSDPGHFGPKTVRHYVFGTEMSYFFLPVPKCLWDTSALVPKCLGQIGGAFLFLYRFTTSRHICTIHRDLLTTCRDILYIFNSYWPRLLWIRAGSPRREPFRIVLQNFFTGLVSLKRVLLFYVIRYLAYLYSVNPTRA